MRDLIKGGQGRDPIDLESDASALAVGGAVLFCLVSWWLIYWLCV